MHIHSCKLIFYSVVSFLLSLFRFRMESVVSGTTGVSVSGSFRWDIGWKGRRKLFTFYFYFFVFDCGAIVAGNRFDNIFALPIIHTRPIEIHIYRSASRMQLFSASHEPRTTQYAVFTCKKNINACWVGLCTKTVRSGWWKMAAVCTFNPPESKICFCWQQSDGAFACVVIYRVNVRRLKIVIVVS